MRLTSVRLLALSTALVATGVQAEPVTAKGAKEIERMISEHLPANVVKRGGLSVTAKGDAYEIRVNSARLFTFPKASGVLIQGLPTLVSMLTPLSDGRYRVTQNSSFNVTGSFKAAGKPTNFAYGVQAINFDGTIDPKLSYLDKAQFDGKGITVKIAPPDEPTTMTLDSFDGQFAATRKLNGSSDLADIAYGVNGAGYNQVIATAKNGTVTLRADAIKSQVAINDAALKDLQAIYAFVFDLLQSDRKKPISIDQQNQLRSVVLKSLPVFSTMKQEVSLENFQVVTPSGTFGAEKVSYEVDSTGAINRARGSYLIGVTAPSLPAGLIPPAFKPLLPTSAVIGVGIRDVNVEDGLRATLADMRFDGTKDAGLSADQMTAIRRQFFPDDKMIITFDGTRVQSPIYDVGIDGQMNVNINESKKTTASFTVYAKDFDRSVDYFQKHSSDTPEFGQVSFFLLMAKGFAETGPDGRQIWRIDVDENDKVLVNGREFKVPGRR